LSWSLTLSDKKDLTRIEDIGEFIHDLNEEEVDFQLSDDQEKIPETEDTEAFDFNSETEASFETEEISFANSEENLEATEVDQVENDVHLSYTDELQEVEQSHEFDPIETPSLRLIDEDPVFTTSQGVSVLEEIKSFAEDISVSDTGAEASPSYSILLTNIKYHEEISDITIILKEFSLLSDSEEATAQRMKRGFYLIPRISEYVCILLCHRLRRFSLDIEAGLTDEIQPKSSTEIEHGSVSKNQLEQNKVLDYKNDQKAKSIDHIQVFLSHLPPQMVIAHDYGIITDSIYVPTTEVESENSSEINKYYDQLVQKLKKTAFVKQANTIYHVQFSLTPLVNQTQSYRLTGTGNIAWTQRS